MIALMIPDFQTDILLDDWSAAIFDAGSSDVVRLNPDVTFHSVLAPAGKGPRRSDNGDLDVRGRRLAQTEPQCKLHMTSWKVSITFVDYTRGVPVRAGHQPPLNRSAPLPPPHPSLTPLRRLGNPD